MKRRGNFAGIIHAVFVISRRLLNPSRSATGVINPLSASTKYCPFLDLTITALRDVPTPGSTTTGKTVPEG